MSTLKVNNLQVGQDPTATNNFALYQPTVPDGTVRLAVGNVGSLTDRLTITSGGNLGIGTTNPVGQLQVSSGPVIIGSGSSTGTVDQDLQVTGGGYFSGNVGIGNTNPDHLLNINGSSNHLQVSGTTARIRVNRPNASGTNAFDFQTNGLFDWAFGSVSAGSSDLIYRSRNDGSSLDVLTLKYSGGNVGIGTTNPQEKLHVAGNVQIGANDTSSAKIELGYGAIGNRYAYIDFIGDTTYSDYGLRVIRYNTGANAISQISHRGTGELGLVTLESAPITFSIGGSEQIRIDTNGRLGIGSISPTQRLDVSGVAQFVENGATLNLVGTDHTYIQWYPDGLAAGRKAYTGFPNATNNQFTIANQISDGSGHITLLPGSNASLLVSTSSATGTSNQKLQVGGGAYVSGNLGVGRTNPLSSLSVIADTDVASIGGYDGANTFVFGLGREINSLSFDAYSGIYFRTGSTSGSRSGSIKAVIDSSGSVGIGISNPAAKLDVYGGSLLVRNPGGASTIEVGVGQNSNQFAYIDFVGDTTYTDYGLRMLRGNGGANAVSYIEHRGTGAFSIYTTEAAPIVFYTTNTERVRIDSSGNVNLVTANKYLRFNSASTTFDINGANGATDYLKISANSTERFQFNSLGAAYNSTGTWGTISDARIKENITDATSKIEDLKKIRVVNYNLKTDPEIKQIGFVAQEIEKVYPSIVDEIGDIDGLQNVKAVKTTILIPILVKSLQETIDLIEKLKTKVETLEKCVGTSS